MSIDAMKQALEVLSLELPLGSHLELKSALRAAIEHPRQWQGLTDEEREQVINANFGTGLWQMAKDIEAKLKEKNT
jgi:hypothetical protein